MTDVEFNSFKTSLILKLTEAVKNLKQENEIIWECISSHLYDFDRRELEAKQVALLTMEDVLMFYREKIEKRRKLSSWITKADLSGNIGDVQEWKSGMTLGFSNKPKL